MIVKIIINYHYYYHNKVLSWEEKGQHVLPLLPYNFRNSLHRKNDHTPFRAPIVKIGIVIIIIIIIAFIFLLY